MDAEQVKLLLISGALGAVGCLVLCKIFSRKKHVRPPPGAARGLKLYQSGFINRSSRCMWMLAELGIRDEVQIIDYDIYTVSEEEKKWYRDNIHPHATIPALALENKEVLTESLGICMYLAERYSDLLPDEEDRANYIDWCVYGALTVDEVLNDIYFNLYNFNDNPLKSEAILKRASSRFDECILRLEKHLRGRDYICGKRFTTADIIMGYNMMWASTMKGGVLIQEFVNVKAYLARLKKRPAFTSEIGTSRDWIHGFTLAK